MNTKVGGLRVYRRWTHIPEWTYARQYFRLRLAAIFHKGKKIDLKRFQNSKRTHPLTNLNTNKSFYVDKYLALVGMYMLLRNLSKFIQLQEIS
jgi:hypothetical protein